MDDKIAELISSLGAEGMSAFYFYVITERLEFLVFMALCAWACRSAWPVIKKELES